MNLLIEAVRNVTNASNVLATTTTLESLVESRDSLLLLCVRGTAVSLKQFLVQWVRFRASHLDNSEYEIVKAEASSVEQQNKCADVVLPCYADMKSQSTCCNKQPCKASICKDSQKCHAKQACDNSESIVATPCTKESSVNACCTGVNQSSEKKCCIQDSKCNETKACSKLQCCENDVGEDCTLEIHESPPESTTTFIHVNGMDCPSCAKSIETKLITVKGIVAVKVFFASERVEIVHNTSLITEVDLVKSINSLGYKASLLRPELSNQMVLSLHIRPDYRYKYSEMELKRLILQNRGVITVNILAPKNHIYEAVINYDPDVTGVRMVLDSLNKDEIDAQPATNHKKQISSRGSTAQNWKRIFILCLIFAFPIFIITILSAIPTVATGLQISIFRGLTIKLLIEWILCSPIQLILAIPIYKSALLALRRCSLSMDVLISLSSGTAYLYSVVSIIVAMALPSYTTNYFFDTSAFLLTLIVFGRYLEVMAVKSTSSALDKLMQLQTPTAILLTQMPVNNANQQQDDYIENEIDINLVQRNDLLKIATGNRIPTDGIIMYGSAMIDESMVTGEALPMTKTVNDIVISGTINQNGLIHMKVTKLSSENTLSAIYKLVENAQASKTQASKLADRIATIFIPFVLLLSAIMFILWFLLAYFNVLPDRVKPQYGALPFALAFAITILVVSCPCAFTYVYYH